MTQPNSTIAPLGVSLDGDKGTIRVFSSTATSIEFLVLDPNDSGNVLQRITLRPMGDGVWSATSPAIELGTHYALRASGPDGPRHAFNHNLNLIDPYARGVVRESAREFHNVVVDDSFDWQGVQKPNTPLKDTVIYEAHARGLTRGNLDLHDDIRGTYAALAHPSTIAHLKEIGITAVELLPVQMFISEPRLMNMGLINYWGYNTINFFTPHHRYASSTAIEAGPQAILNEFKTAVRELHRAGIEVILDVVYNHTAEGGARGLTYSFRGLDNSYYYRQDDYGNYHDTTGCGNSLDFSNSRVVDLVMDSLRYWTNEMQIDGFRFDLATTLARDKSNQYDPNHEMLRRMVEEPALAESKLILEPWDIGLGGWQTGNFPDRFSEWNDRYRDSVRRFWLSDVASARNSRHFDNGVADLATRLSGSRDVVDGTSGPLGSINFITAHDGFCLHDLVTYNVKHNQMNGEGNRDGNSNNFSFNHGAEGEVSDEAVNVQRRRARRNLLATLLLSAGVPMVTAGDEVGKTQLGNNNAYCQDINLSWVNWKLSEHQQNLKATFAHLTKLRSDNGSLRQPNFGNFDEAVPGNDMIKWFAEDGTILTEDQWNNAGQRTLMRLAKHINRDETTSNTTLMVIHGTESDIEVTLPVWDQDWEIVWDSASELPPSNFKSAKAGSKIKVSATSILLLRAK
jgi:glycogen operon protein